MNSERCSQCKHFIIANAGEGKIYGCDRSKCVFEPTAKNDLGVNWESYKDADGNSLDYLILNVLQNNFDCGDEYGYIVADKIIDLLPSVTPQPTKNDLGVEEVTALAEWTEKLTKASEDAYNKGYADGVKSINICPHCGEYIGEEE